jgi:hypothetical protein
VVDNNAYTNLMARLVGRRYLSESSIALVLAEPDQNDQNTISIDLNQEEVSELPAAA